jgi:hypothetical protein
MSLIISKIYLSLSRTYVNIQQTFVDFNILMDSVNVNGKHEEEKIFL